jgi:DNA repair protein RecN (Recombination protein N)
LPLSTQLRLEFGPGLNILTGETGAGKSIIIDAVGLLLGDRAAAEWVRAGADLASIEAAFVLPADAERAAPSKRSSKAKGWTTRTARSG